MLERMDSLNLFPRVEGGPLPFLLLDGHGSRFQLPFMRYIEDKEHKWKVCIGVPNGTAHWQVGDSAEQNGSWKMATTRDKRKLSQFRISMGMPLSIKPSDIVPVVNTAWKQSFARVPSNKRAISRRGWQPLNRGLLKHPEVLKTKVSQTRTTTPSSQEIVPTAAAIVVHADSPTVLSDITNTITSDMTNTITSDMTNTTVASSSDKSLPKALNLTSGYAGDFVTGMLQYAIKNEKNTENLTNRYKDGRTLKESLSKQENKRFTAGSLFKANRVAIDSELLEYMEEKEEEAVRVKHATIIKHTNDYLTNKKRGEEVLASNKKPEAMINSELKAVVKWKKRKGDDAIPSTKPLLIQRCTDTMERIDQTLTQFLEENGLQHQEGWL
jgi:hypothetical protein